MQPAEFLADNLKEIGEHIKRDIDALQDMSLTDGQKQKKLNEIYELLINFTQTREMLSQFTTKIERIRKPVR